MKTITRSTRAMAVAAAKLFQFETGIEPTILRQCNKELYYIGVLKFRESGKFIFEDGTELEKNNFMRVY